MLTYVLVFAPLVYFIILNIISDANHFAYASVIAKNEGIKQYIPALICSYMYHPRYFTFGLFNKHQYNNAVMSKIEYFVRTHSNNDPNARIYFSHERSRIRIRSELYPAFSIQLTNVSVYEVMGECLILPPSHVRYIEKYLLKCVDHED
jgi:hypothetical protein